MPDDELKERIRSLMAEVLEMDPEAIEDNEQFSKLGADSLARVELLASLEREMDVHLPLESQSELETVEAIASAIEETGGD